MLKKIITVIARVWSRAVYLIIIALILIAVPFVAGYRPVVVLSGSMAPAYPVGSIIYYKPAGFDEIDVGDAITFRLGEGSSLATHRVTNKDTAAQNFVTKGDNNVTEDTNPVPYGRVVGKAARIAIPYAGFVTSYLKQVPVIAVMGAILLLDVFMSPKEKKGKREKQKKAGAAAEQNEEAAGKKVYYHRAQK